MTIVYFGCRYALVTNPVFLVGLLKIGGISCNSGYLVSGILSIGGLLCIFVAWGIRIYALYNKKAILVWFTSLGAAALIADSVRELMRANLPSSQPHDKMFMWLVPVATGRVLLYSRRELS